MSVKAAFIFIVPENDYKIHRTVIDSPVVKLSVVGVEHQQPEFESGLLRE